MSATLESQKLCDFFDVKHDSILYVSGRLHPVDILYTPTPIHDALDGALRSVVQVRRLDEVR